MSDVFFSRSVDAQLREIVDKLYTRLSHSRRLLDLYDSDIYCSDRDRGYAQGIREEIGYLVRLLDIYERS